MRFLIDAQLPARLARTLTAAGHDAIHSVDLRDGNLSTDAQIASVADEQNRVVVTKDRDFRASHLLQGTPRRLLIVATGNISNRDLLALFERHLAALVEALEEVRFVELGPGSLVIHDDRPEG